MAGLRSRRRRPCAMINSLGSSGKFFQQHRAHHKALKSEVCKASYPTSLTSNAKKLSNPQVQALTCRRLNLKPQAALSPRSNRSWQEELVAFAHGQVKALCLEFVIPGSGFRVWGLLLLQLFMATPHCGFYTNLDRVKAASRVTDCEDASVSGSKYWLQTKGPKGLRVQDLVYCSGSA